MYPPSLTLHRDTEKHTSRTFRQLSAFGRYRRNLLRGNVCTSHGLKLNNLAFPAGVMKKPRYGYIMRMYEISSAFQCIRLGKPRADFEWATFTAQAINMYTYIHILISVWNIGLRLTAFGNLDRRTSDN